MTSLERVTQSPFTRVGREISRLSSSSDVAMAQTQFVTIQEIATLDAIQQIAGRAMQGVALVSQLEQHLSVVAPEAEGRLRAIGDIHAISSAEIVARAPRRLW